MSQQELAERSGLSVRAVSDLERGRTRFPYPDSLARLAGALGLRDQARMAVIAAARRRPPGRGGAAAAPRPRPSRSRRSQHARPVRDPGELAASIWESDAELQAFLAGLRAARNASAA